MKQVNRSWLLSLVMASTLLMSACGGAAQPTAAPTAAPAATKAVAEPTKAIAEPTKATAATAAPQAAGGGSGATIRVASKDFTEEFIVGEMYALLLEDAGFKVERKLNLGGTPVAQQALLSNQIDLYPEYTGTGLLTVLKMESFDKKADAKAVYAAVAKGYADQFKLAWLDPAPMNNTQALAMTKEGSDKYGVKTISDLAAKASQLTMIGPPEFETRQDGLPGIQKAYGDFKLKRYVGADPGLRYQALTGGQADVVVAFGTDGQLAAFNLVSLKDDKGLFPIYQIAPVVRQDVLTANPKIKDALNAVSSKMDDATMQRLNYEVDGKKREPADVAKEFLTQQGLLKNKK